MRIGILIGLLFLAQNSHAGSAKELYFKCENEPGAKFKTCAGTGINADRSDLQADFERRWKILDNYLKTNRGASVASGCQDAYMKFVKEDRGRVRLLACSADGKCRNLSREITLVLTEAQRNEILAEKGTPKKTTNIFGQKITVVQPRPYPIETSCNERGGLCFSIIKQVVGFDHEPDATTVKFGARGVIYERVDPDLVGIGQGKKTVYNVKKRIAYAAPVTTMIERLGDLYSNRQTSIVAHAIDHAMSEESARDIVFNMHLVTAMQQKLRALVNSRAKEMKFSFLEGDQVCADGIYQLNRVRRGMNIHEAFLLRKKDTSGDLASTIGGALKFIGDGFSVTINGFLDEQVRRARGQH